MTWELVQAFCTPNSNAGASNRVWSAKFPNKSLAGNALSFQVQTDTSPTSCTITDDKGNTWTSTGTLTGGQKLWTFRVLNAVTDTRRITITFNVGAAPAFVSFSGQEWKNAATSGTSLSSGGDTTNVGTVQSGSFSPTAGDLILQISIDDAATPAVGITGFTPGASCTPISANRYDGIYIQYRTAPGGAINLQHSVGGSANNFMSLAISLPAGSSGTSGSGCRIVNVHQFAIDSSVGGTSLAFDVPTVGNLLLMESVLFNNTGLCKFTAFSDTGTNAWTESGTVATSGGVSGDVQQWYEPNMTPSASLVVTGTLNQAQNSGSTVYFKDIAGAATSPFDVEGHATGVQAVGGNLSNAPQITPSAAGGVVSAVIGIESHATSDNATSGTYLYDSPGNASEDGGGNPEHQDNGWSHTYPTSTSALAFDWTFNSNPSGIQNWAAKATSFLAPAAATKAAPFRTPNNALLLH
jgi:hypothetical protein